MRLQNLSETRRSLFEDQDKRLLLTVAGLLGCSICAEGLINEACELVSTDGIPAAFEYSFALRAIVRLTLNRMNIYTVRPESRTQCNHPASLTVTTPQIASLPSLERAAFLLRDVLGYSRRDASLLMGTTDSQVDRLQELAHRRLMSVDHTCAEALRDWYRKELFDRS